MTRMMRAVARPRLDTKTGVGNIGSTAVPGGLTYID